MTWAPMVKTTSTTEHVASISLEFKSMESPSSAELGLAKILKRAAEDIERAVDKRQNVMAP